MGSQASLLSTPSSRKERKERQERTLPILITIFTIRTILLETSQLPSMSWSKTRQRQGIHPIRSIRSILSWKRKRQGCSILSWKRQRWKERSILSIFSIFSIFSILSWKRQGWKERLGLEQLVCRRLLLWGKGQLVKERLMFYNVIQNVEAVL